MIFYKKSQMTLFLIVGVIIIVAGIFYFTTTSSSLVSDTSDNVISDFSPSNFQSSLQQCLETTQRNAIEYIISHGGYFVLPINSRYNLPVYIQEETIIHPSLDEVSTQLENYISFFSRICLQEQKEAYEELGFSVDYTLGEVTTRTQIQDTSVTSEVNFDINLQSNSIDYSYTQITLQTPSFGLKHLHNISVAILEYQLLDLHSICLSCLKRLEDENNILIRITHLEKGYYQFDLINRDENLLDNEQYSYQFLYHLTSNQDETQDNVQLEVNKIEDQSLKVGEILRIQVESNIQDVSYTSLSPLIEINRQGQILYQADEFDVGTYQVVILVEDSQGNIEEVSFNLEVRA